MSSDGSEDEWEAEQAASQQAAAQEAAAVEAANAAAQAAAASAEAAAARKAAKANSEASSMAAMNTEEILLLLKNTTLDDPEDDVERVKILREAADLSHGIDSFGDGTLPDEFKFRAAKLLTAQMASRNAAKRRDDEAGSSFGRIKLERVRDVEILVEACRPAIENSQAKSPTWLRFLDELLAVCIPKMDVKDLNTLHKKLSTTLTQRQTEANLLAQKSKKAGNLAPSTRNFKDEMDMVYGDRSDVESEFEDEESDDDSKGSSKKQTDPVPAAAALASPAAAALASPAAPALASPAAAALASPAAAPVVSPAAAALASPAEGSTSRQVLNMGGDFPSIEGLKTEQFPTLGGGVSTTATTPAPYQPRRGWGKR